MASDLKNSFTESLDNSKHCAAFHINLLKVFIAVDHAVLKDRLHTYLSEHSVCFTANYQSKKKKNVKTKMGVPHGSLLGLLFTPFTLYIKSISLNVPTADVVMDMDGTVMYCFTMTQTKGFWSFATAVNW